MLNDLSAGTSMTSPFMNFPLGPKKPKIRLPNSRSSGLTFRGAYSEENDGFLHGSGESSANQKGLNVVKGLLRGLAEFLLSCVESAISKRFSGWRWRHRCF